MDRFRGIKRYLLKKGIFKFEYPPVEIFSKRLPESRISRTIREEMIEPCHDQYMELLGKMREDRQYFEQIPLSAERGLVWQNHYYPGLDVMALFTLLRTMRPKRVIEVGSGYSTLVLALSRDVYSLPIQITCIDPNPRTDVSNSGVEFIREKVQHVDPDIFRDLGEGDFLMIDSSHRILPGSDLEHLFENVLPVLNSGVVVHVHDIYIPYRYPLFMRERLYSEQQLLRQFLYYRKDIQVLFPAYYVHRSGLFDTEIKDLFHELDPRIERHGGAFWFRITE